MRFTSLIELGFAGAGAVAAVGGGGGGGEGGIAEVLGDWKDNPRASYPTQFTRDITPVQKKIHSHNDYWREVPLLSAISNGAISVEADVWLYNETLYVGHDTSSLTADRTFESLYINPLVEILTRQNPTSRFVDGKTRNGVFDASVAQTLYLFVDLKTPGPETWPHVVRALAPLRSLDYLSAVNGSAITPGPVTVIGTGNTPIDLIRPVLARDYFYDGPLLSLDADDVTPAVSPIASAQLVVAVGEVVGSGLNRTQKEEVRRQVEGAHKRGVMARYWDLPAWPVSTRNEVWKELVNAGVDLLNTDDLEAAAGVLAEQAW